MTTYAIRIRETFAQPRGFSRQSILAGIVFLAVAFAVVAFAAGAFQKHRTSSASQVCEHAFCLRLPPGWTGRTEYGGESNQLIAAPFRLPSWVGNHKQGVISIPSGRFVIIVWVYGRGYLLDWPRRQALSIPFDRFKPQPKITDGSPRSVAHSLVTLKDRSFEVWVQFRDRNPSHDQIAAVNAELASLYRASPPRRTS